MNTGDAAEQGRARKGGQTLVGAEARWLESHDGKEVLRTSLREEQNV